LIENDVRYGSDECQLFFPLANDLVTYGERDRSLKGCAHGDGITALDKPGDSFSHGEDFGGHDFSHIDSKKVTFLPNEW
jgi:hypothetical protein